MDKTQRQLMVAGNWKMNKTYHEGRELAQAVSNKLQASEHKVVICTPYIQLKSVSTITEGVSNFHVGAQNMHHEDAGAYTGEISASMLKSVGTEYVILGHSERREYFGEDDTLVGTKVEKALAADLLPIYCCGEKLDIREAGTHLDHVGEQMKTALFSPTTCYHAPM